MQFIEEIYIKKQRFIGRSSEKPKYIKEEKHMYEFSKKQKIIIILIGIILIIAFLYYTYAKDENMLLSEELEVTNTTENTEENENTTQEEQEMIVVHVSGAVNKEGIVELEENSRISDAIDKAEGLKENADTKNINLAFKLEDGMKIYIPTIEETAKELEEENTNDKTQNYITSSGGVVQGENSTSTSSGKQKTGKININTATQTELETLPGIGPSTSLKIVNYREENGDFKSIEQIKEVSGIGDAKYENIKDLICVK